MKALTALSRGGILHELLAPAGDMESLKMAVIYGADAVYLGADSYGMRAGAKNFTLEQLREAVDFAHSHDVKVYLTANVLPHTDEIELYPDFIRQAADCGIDAAICADIGVMALTQENAPSLEIHISTQAGIVNHVTANQFYKMGAKRVVLAREVSIQEISKIRAKIPADMDIEAFVHGAMCMSFSGRCLLSSYLTGRDANRGECTQPCRWKYYLVEEKRLDQPMELYENEKGSYILNAKDLCMLEHLEQLIYAGVTSFKIEGRAKSAYYTAVVVNAYRIALDCVKFNKPIPEWVKQEVQKVSHRQYSTGFYFGKPTDCQYYENSGYIRNYDFIGVINGSAGGKISLTQRNYFKVGDEAEILAPKAEPELFTIDNLYDDEGNAVEVARHPLQKLFIKTEKEFPEYSIMRRAAF